MRLRFLVCLLFMASGVQAPAQSLPMRSLDSGDAAEAWQAVGRLELDGSGFCTGALIAPDLVLTAAHCLFDNETGTQLDPRRIEFRAGWRQGRASAYRQVRRAALHPDFRQGRTVSPERVRADVALLQLDQPIRNTSVIPLPTAARPAPGASVGVVSYARNRADAPSLQELCDVVSRRGGVLVTSCAVDFGASGAPIFVMEAGVARIVSVVSAKAEIEGRPVSLGADLQDVIADLRRELNRPSGSFRNPPPAVSHVIAGDRQRAAGAKFIRLKE